MNHNKSLITMSDPMSYVSESYKMFRTNLNYVNIDMNLKVILFTSSTSEEGKTTTVANTAITMAQTGKKVLILECDLRLARVHKLFNMRQTPGLTNVLSDRTDLSKAIQKVNDVDSLDVLTSGILPPSPSELLGSNAFITLLAEVRELYDVVLIDAPPVLHVSDAGILSRMVDGVVLVVASEKTKKEEAVQAKKALEKVNANIIGVILTKVKNKKKNSYYQYNNSSKK